MAQEKAKAGYEVILDEIEKSCGIISELKKIGCEFEQPAMAAEKAHVLRLLEMLENTKEAHDAPTESYVRLENLLIKGVPSPLREFLINTSSFFSLMVK